MVDYFLYKCVHCKAESKALLQPSMPHLMECPKCRSVGYYWHGQFNSDYIEPKPPSTCLSVFCFWADRLEKFLENFSKYPAGVDYDLFFVHNAFEVEGIYNKEPRSQDEIKRVREVIDNFDHPNKVVLERENIGEDLGGSRFLFKLLQDRYAHFFFLNEVASVRSDGWLKPFIKCYEENPLVVACGPKVIKKDNKEHQYILCSTYWSLRSSFGKDIVWPIPTNRAEAKVQEMELIWRQANKMGYNIAQVGSGDNLLHYKVPTHMCAGEGVY